VTVELHKAIRFRDHAEERRIIARKAIPRFGGRRYRIQRISQRTLQSMYRLFSFLICVTARVTQLLTDLGACRAVPDKVGRRELPGNPRVRRRVRRCCDRHLLGRVVTTVRSGGWSIKARGRYLQELNLKDVIRVLQSKGPLIR